MIREFEGLRLVAYGDIGGVMTIGYGHTRNVRPGETITRATAEQYLHEDIQTCEHDIGMTVCVQMTQNQYDALVSWIFNLGLGAWQKSGALRHLNMGEYDTCIAIMQLYIRAADRIIPGLQRRREAEALLWREPDAETAQKP
jgi:lysozyme